MIVMSNITFAEAEAGHRELWDWLSETGGNVPDKRPWPGWDKYDRNARNSCFACEIASRISSEICAACPIEWPGPNFCDHEDSLYNMWDHRAEDLAARKLLAAVIRDLPWREERNEEQTH